MDVTVKPGKLGGTVTAPSSKSVAHRALICATLGGGTSRLGNLGKNDDILASLAIAEAMGARCTHQPDGWTLLEGISKNANRNQVLLDCNESGSTLRFFAPIAAALGLNARFLGQGRLPQRPMEPLLSLMEEHGVKVDRQKEGAIFSLSGQLEAGIYKLPGDVSSQYISGLLFALPLLKETSEIRLTSPLQSAGYVAMTLEMLEKFGIEIDQSPQGYLVKGRQQYQPQELMVEGDYSGAAFWLGAAALGHEIMIDGLNPRSLQADLGIVEVLERFGATPVWENRQLVLQTGTLEGITIDAREIPDSVPILAVVGAFAVGTTLIINAQRLRIKESDRLESTTAGLLALGVEIRETEDGLLIEGGRPLTGGVVDSYGDHRIAMAMSIAALGAAAPVTVLGAQCVEKSYPDFYRDLKRLGGVVDGI